MNIENTLKKSLDVRWDLLMQYNKSYREGNPEITDKEYDLLVDSLPEDDSIHNIGIEIEVSDSRKTKLPISMASMNKVKTIEEIQKWCKSKDISSYEMVVLTPKYDGISLLYECEKELWTRGDGKYGQSSFKHYQELIKSKPLKKSPALKDLYLVGEGIMKRSLFKEKYSKDFKNPRNMVAGLFNHKTAKSELQDVSFMTYGIADCHSDKVEVLKTLNRCYNQQEIPFEVKQISEITDEFLQTLYAKWNTEYEIDGIIIEINNNTLRNELGSEKNGNPCYARAWKGFDEMKKETIIIDIAYQVSKEGNIIPVAQVMPIELDGVTVQYVSLYNIRDMIIKGLGVGAKVLMVRSGMVIPKIIETLIEVEATPPEFCPSCDSVLKNDENSVHLVCDNEYCDEKCINHIISFFEILGVDNVGEGVVKQFYKNGYMSEFSILNLNENDLLQMDRFGEKKAKLVYNSIHSKMKNVSLEKIQHASGLFKGLGSKKLVLLNQFDSPDKKPDLETLLTIDGFSNISANTYLEGFDSFWKYLDEAPIPINICKPKEIVIVGDTCVDMNVVFTGFRDKELEAQIIERGGKISSGVSKKTTHLIVKDKDSTSSKIEKAHALGIVVWPIEDLNNIL